MQTALASIPDAALFYQGGITAYNLGQKYKHLSVEPVHAQQVNCVSEQVATEMAINVARQFTSDWGIGITGYCTPVPESGNKLFAYFAISFKNKVIVKGKIISGEKEPKKIQDEYAEKVFQRVTIMIMGKKRAPKSRP
jgi:nicotinamide-nucleotide amidase